ncbi:MAG: hypothetical protein JKX76_01410 [Colwellia sp.]|nr:hypothetical protein [Colwellia sp.]
MFTLVISICLLVIIVALASWMIYKQIEEYNSPDDYIDALKLKLAPVYPGIMDIPIKKGEKSFTINKKEIFLCMEDQNGEYYPEHVYVHVLLHECAHVLAKNTIGHTPEFYKMFDGLVKKAESLGIYDSRKPIPKDYCDF